ncbi:biotin synthase BioB [Anaplasma capra]|uniref:biotin synthase BioB n=1 Tax=Anaplasma capra TaxID=1562740 RepID=UPI0021D5E821|nr:biotin synthase BioB [Anaplasma capra]MCU7611821.1 biotin synthase BioB [Anaplasma capra]MCU7612585.1 biotin synthase BioB [Anaplasma capra]
MTARNNWTFEEALELLRRPFHDLILEAHIVHRRNFQHNRVQVAVLMNIKTGSCPENCCYCAQSAHYSTGLEKKSLATVEEVRAAAKRAKGIGADRFCFAAAWRNLHDRDLGTICKFVEAVKSEGLESCASLGMLKLEQARKLRESGLDFYNHNVDTSREFYSNVVTTRTYEERLETIRNVQRAGIKVCCGGILGMGESTEDRARMLVTLANLEEHPLSVPINRLVPIEGTPMGGQPKISNIDFIRTVACARIMMPASYVRLAAGRGEMSEEMQALCMFAGANSIFCGEQLLTTPNARPEDDQELLSQLGIASSLAHAPDAQLA